MQFPAVNWHEGLFLQPHHFQAWDRHWSERVSLGERWQSPFGYGVLELSINRDALAAGFLQIDVLRCKTPGGTLIDAMSSQHWERRDLRPAMDLATQRTASIPSERGGTTSAAVDIYVGVPHLQLGMPNVDSSDHRNGARYVAHCIDVPDELDAACVRPVEVRNVNSRLLIEGDDLAGFDLLRIARVRLSRQSDGLFQLDRQYVPPLMDCSGHELLRTEVLTSLSDQLQHADQRLTHQLLDAGGELHAHSAVDVRRLVAMQAISPAASVFNVLAFSRGVHPLVAYTEMARLAGALDLLNPKRAIERTSPYDHENLGPLFFALKRRIAAALEGLRQDKFWQANFVGAEHGMQVSIDPVVLAQNRRWFIGIQRGSCTAEAVKTLFHSGNLDWKLGSAPRAEQLFASRQVGLELRPASQIPLSLPQGDQWLYYEIINCDSAAWAEVRSSGALAFRISDAMIVGRERLPGSPAIELRLGGQTFVLQLALFGAA